MNINGMFQEMGDWLSHPMKKDMPMAQILLLFVLFVVIAYIVYDAINILKEGMS